MVFLLPNASISSKSYLVDVIHTTGFALEFRGEKAGRGTEEIKQSTNV